MSALALLVAGPTASGKSALALSLAERFGGTVINADAMQLYAGLRVLTARPSDAEAARVPHRLYGVREPAEPADVAWWRGAALSAMAEARQGGRLPILCGGTGLFFHALRNGLAPIPAVPAAARAEARALLAALGPAGLHARLLVDDAETAAALRPSDSQRIARAWEVWRGTGRGLVSWQREPGGGPPPEWHFAALLLDPPREALRTAIAARFADMLATGALDEVRALLAAGLDPALPAMRAHGVPELAAHLRGDLTLDAAARRAILNTGQYTKRQATWFRHHDLAHAHNTHMIHARYAGSAQYWESIQAEIFAFIEERR